MGIILRRPENDPQHADSKADEKDEKTEEWAEVKPEEARRRRLIVNYTLLKLLQILTPTTV